MSGPYQESWESFGLNINSFISKNSEELKKYSFDVIIGFSRGGTILANILSCLLKDNFEEYSKPSKASVRPVPKGLFCKRDDPCFVMNQPASFHEMKDITNNLEKDLEEFVKRYNNSEPISVLVIDDNLTGATRINFIENKLNKMSCIKSYKLLAYVRNPAFSKNKIPLIREFPKDAEYFIMPWHQTYHETKAPSKKELVLEDAKNDFTKLKFYINFADKFNPQELLTELGKEYDVRSNLLINGASIFTIKISEENKSIELGYLPIMFYPPKQCLKSYGNSSNNLGAFGSLSVCLLGTDKTMDACLICSYLNCNSSLIKKILTFEKVQPVLLIKEFAQNGKINKKIKPAVEKWFNVSLPKMMING